MANLNDKENMQFDEELMKQLSKEELEIVNGGYLQDTSEDSIFLYGRRLIPERYEEQEVLWKWSSISPMIEEAWKKLGVTCVTHMTSPNEYYYKGEEISHRDALSVAFGLNQLNVGKN